VVETCKATEDLPICVRLLAEIESSPLAEQQLTIYDKARCPTGNPFSRRQTAMDLDLQISKYVSELQPLYRLFTSKIDVSGKVRKRCQEPLF